MDDLQQSDSPGPWIETSIEDGELVVRHRLTDTVCEMKLAGVLQTQTVPALKDLLDSPPFRDLSAYEFDLSELDFVDSTGMGLLVILNQQKPESAERTAVRVVAVSQPVRIMFRVTGLENLLIEEPTVGVELETPGLDALHPKS